MKEMKKITKGYVDGKLVEFEEITDPFEQIEKIVQNFKSALLEVGNHVRRVGISAEGFVHRLRLHSWGAWGSLDYNEEWLRMLVDSVWTMQDLDVMRYAIAHQSDALGVSENGFLSLATNMSILGYTAQQCRDKILSIESAHELKYFAWQVAKGVARDGKIWGAFR